MTRVRKHRGILGFSFRFFEFFLGFSCSPSQITDAPRLTFRNRHSGNTLEERLIFLHDRPTIAEDRPYRRSICLLHPLPALTQLSYYIISIVLLTPLVLSSFVNLFLFPSFLHQLFPGIDVVRHDICRARLRRNYLAI